MTHELDIRQFFRKSPKYWLQRYFEKAAVFSHIGWATIRVRNVEPLMEAWRDLDEDLRGRMVEEFREINLLATPAGKVQIIDEALFHGKQNEVSAKLAELAGFYECAFWTFLEQPDCWRGAVSFADADGKPRRQWRKRINMPPLGRSSTATDGHALKDAIIELFRRREGRGDHCVVEQYRRGAYGEKEYYFAYPQDHRQMAIEFNGGQMTRRPHKPAFEIIFIHDDMQRTLSIWHHGQRERTGDLQAVFARSILGQEIPRESPRDDRVYDLNAFLKSDFAFHPRPELGIASTDVRKITLRILGAETYAITVDLGAKTPSHALREALTGITANTRPTMVKVSKVSLRVTFDRGADGQQPAVRKFDLAWPNSCNLRDDSHGMLIQRMLADHGIEPRKPSDETRDGDQGK